MKSTGHLMLLLILAAGTATLCQAAPLEAAKASSDPTTAASAAAAPSTPDETADTIGRSQAIRRRLNRADIASIAIDSDPNTDDGLMEYIKQLEALQLPAPKTEINEAAAPATVSAPAAMSKSDKSVVSKAEPNQPSAPAPYRRELDTLLKDPAMVVHALAAAEALYQANDQPHAAAFYRIALERMGNPENADAGHVAWAMFQLANCLRTEDPAGAAALYEQLAAQYPNSPWTAAAAVQRKLIAWYGVNQPDQLLERYSRDPNSL